MASRRRPIRLPAAVYSSQGPVPVLTASLPESDEEGKVWGEFGIGPRSIELDEEASRPTQLQTLWHEVTHIALSDSGVNELLSRKLEEAICTAVGSYLSAAIYEGYLKMSVPKDKR